MAETLEQFIVRRRGELDEETSKLQAQLRVIDAERERVNKVAMMFAGEPTVETAPVVGIAMQGHGLPAYPFAGRNPKRMSEATIKSMVMTILEKEGCGMSALDILARINEEPGVDYPRSSLSPQLSRLKADGKIHREGRLWTLGGGDDVGRDDEADMGLLTSPVGGEPITDEAPAEGAGAS